MRQWADVDALHLARRLVMAGYDRYPRWVRIGVWVCLVGLLAMVLASVFSGFV